MTKLQRTSHLQPPTLRTPHLALGFWIFSGAWTLGSWSFAATPATPPVPPASEAAPLSRIVSRLSTAENRTGRDWAEFARETATWGSRLQSSGEQVPEGPVRDALAAVDLGSQLDPKTADWPKLRQELEALLQKPEEPPPQENQDQQNQQDQQQQDQQNQNQQKQDQQQKQNSSDQPQEQQDQQQQQKDSDQQQEPQNSENSQQQQKNQPQGREDQSAFGDMEEKNIPPPPEETQQVGGAPERKEGTPPPTDPNLALPLQKLEQLKNQDSPAELFQLMESRPENSSRKTKKDW